VELVICIAAGVVSWLVFTWLLRVVKTTLKTAFLVAAIVMVLQITIGVGPNQLWQAVTELPQQLEQLFNNQS
jgi:predicted PurR-regulated permease PerM